MNENELLRAILGLCQQWNINTQTGSAPVNTVAPVLTSSGNLSFPIAGNTLSCTTGTWTNSPTGYTYAFKWEDGTVLQTGAGNTYHIVNGDVGHAIHCTVTASNGSGSGTADSNSSGTVGTLPVNVTLPLIDNPLPNIGETLYATQGTWTGATSFTYQWSNDNGPIVGATGLSYTVQFGDIALGIFISVIAHNSYGPFGVDSASTGGAGNVTACVLKLYADNISGVVTDPVATWPDKSGNGNNATQGTPANQPVLAAGLNGHLTVSFDSVDDGLITSANLPNPFTIIVVAQATGSSGNWRIIQSGTLNNVIAFNRASAAVYNSGQVAADTTVNPGTNAAVGSLVVGATSNWYLNGTDRTDSTVFTADWGTVGLGTGGSHSEPAAAKVSAVIAFTVALTTGQRQAVEAYFTAVFGPF